MPHPPCLSCQCDYVYQDQYQLICPECGFEWNPDQMDRPLQIKDANGTLLTQGDKLTLLKDLKVKGSSLKLKIGTKALIKQINDGKDHQLTCKVDGVGEMVISAKFVKKA